MNRIYVFIVLTVVTLTFAGGAVYTAMEGPLPPWVQDIPLLGRLYTGISEAGAGGVLLLDDAKDEMMGEFLGVTIGVMPKDDSHTPMSDEMLAVFNDQLPHTKYVSFKISVRNTGGTDTKLCITDLDSNLVNDQEVIMPANCQALAPGETAVWTTSDVDVGADTGSKYFRAAVSGQNPDGTVDTLLLKREFTLTPDQIQVGDLDIDLEEGG